MAAIIRLTCVCVCVCVCVVSVSIKADIRFMKLDSWLKLPDREMFIFVTGALLSW